MGVGISSWGLASKVAQAGHLGVVSGTALDAVLVRRLQDGDPGGHSRRALEHFPFPEITEKIMRKYYLPEGRKGEPYLALPMLGLKRPKFGNELAVAGNFVEVWLAKHGHDGLVGINFLEKIQLATPAAAYGAMLAGIDYVLMGAGIPRDIPSLLTDLAEGRPGGVMVDINGGEPVRLEFDPASIVAPERLPAVRRPKFLAIISAHVMATYLAREESTRPDGFVIEGHTAGGHNAPPRGKMQLDDTGQPVYGDRDLPNLPAIAKVGLPFWLAGGYGDPEKVREAIDAGAAGVQVGTLFALSRDSGMRPYLRNRLLDEMRAGTLVVRTDAAASPTGFPFKVAQVPDTMSVPEVYAARPRLCDLGYLRELYVNEKGRTDLRCPAEPIDDYLRKGGSIENTVGSKCVCNALMTDVGMGQERREGYHEMPMVTLGSDLDGPKRLDAELQERGQNGWSADDAITWMMRDLDDSGSGLDGAQQVSVSA
jgi:NAD(P)H-dependent flavin oxidoreductase YrpB (nitropropane dioxygenase family)